MVCFVTSRRRHTRCALVTGVQTCALPIYCRRRPGDSGQSLNLQTVCPEHVEGPFLFPNIAKEEQCFDKLSTNGKGENDGKRAQDRARRRPRPRHLRSEEHTSELQSLMRTSYAVFCLKKTTEPTPAPRP